MANRIAIPPPKESNEESKGGDTEVNARVYKNFEKVEINRNGKGVWYKGRVLSSKEFSTGLVYDVRYDNDSTEEKAVSSRLIRAIDSSDDRTVSSDSESVSFKFNEQVECRRDGGVRYHAARIVSVNSNGTYDVRYIDGKEETRMQAKLIRSTNSQTNTNSKSAAGARRLDEDRPTPRFKLQEGSKVEGNYRGRGKWYPGKVTRDRGDGTYDILYNDGESETRVEKDMIRLLDSSRGTVSPGRRSRSPVRRIRSRSPVRPSRHSRSRSPVHPSRRSRSPVMRERREYKNLSRDVLLASSLRKRLVTLFSRYQLSCREGTCRKAFSEIDDVPSTGYISVKEFKTVLRSVYQLVSSKNDSSDDDIFGSSFDQFISDDDLDILAKCYGYNRGNTIAYDDFLAFVLDVQEDKELAAVHTKLQKELLVKSSNRLRLNDVVDEFSKTKTFKYGYVTERDFISIVRSIWSSLTTSDMNCIMKAFCILDDRLIDYYIFSRWVIGDVDKAMGLFLHQTCLLDYDKIDNNGDRFSDSDGFLTLKSFHEFIAYYGVPLNSSDTRLIFEKLDKASVNRIHYEDDILFIIKTASKNLRKSVDSKRVSREGSQVCALVRTDVADMIADGVIEYMKRTDKLSLGRFLCQYSDEVDEGTDTGSRINSYSLSKKSLYRCFNDLDVHIEEIDALLIYEALCYPENMLVNRILVIDLLLYLYSIAMPLAEVPAYQTLPSSLPSCHEICRRLASYDEELAGIVTCDQFESIMRQIRGMSIDNIQSLENYFDPHNTGVIDTSLVEAYFDALENHTRVEYKLKNILKIMRIKDLDYSKYLLGKSASSSADDSSVEAVENVVDTICSPFLGLPMSRLEIDLLINSKYASDGSVDVRSLLTKLEELPVFDKSLRTSKVGTKTSSYSNSAVGKNLGKSLYKKLCYLRASYNQVHGIRSALLACDVSLSGTIQRDEMVKVCDKYIPMLNDVEIQVLLENLGTNKSMRTHMALTMDYRVLLLLLFEPVSAVCNTNVATSFLNNAMKDGGLTINVASLLTLLMSRFIATDVSHTGLVTFEEASKILSSLSKPHSIAVSSSSSNAPGNNEQNYNIASLLEAFLDASSDCIYYLEMVNLPY